MTGLRNVHRVAILSCLVGSLLVGRAPVAPAADCNHNGNDDVSDIGSSTSGDCNANGVPDECDVGPVVAFAPITTLPFGEGPRSVAAADIDRDGLLDLVVANANFEFNRVEERVSIRRGTGARTFGPRTALASGPGTSFVTPADVDGDSDLDLAVAVTDITDAYIRILTNDGGGRFAVAADYPTPGTAPFFIGARSLDGDGLPELVVSYGGFGQVSVFHNQGGTFPTYASLDVLYEPTDIALADFDRDGDLDLAAPLQVSSESGVRLFRNDGSGRLTPRGHVAVGGFPSAVAAVDLTGDGVVDLATADAALSRIAVLAGAGDGTFGAARAYAAGAGAARVVAGDLDGDGDGDLITVDERADTVSVFENNGAGRFAPARPFVVGGDPFAATIADLDGDGGRDVAVANRASATVTILWNRRTMSPPQPASPDCNANRRPDRCDVAAGDCDGNGTPDDCSPDGDGDGITDACDPCPAADNDLDYDRDGVPDCLDGCPYDPERVDPGPCGCGVLVEDRDSDAAADCIDNCPFLANPDQRNQDGDGRGDACDDCPHDSLKTAPGQCGCGTADADSDSDFVPDCEDRCPTDYFKTRPGRCGCGLPETPRCAPPTPLSATPTWTAPPTATPRPTAIMLRLTVGAVDDRADAIPGDGRCATAQGDCTLRAAIQEANARAGADTIVVPAGLYVLSVVGREEEAAAGDLDIRDTLVLRGAGPASTVIDGGGIETVLEIHPDVVASVAGVTIRNGRSNGIAGGVANHGVLSLRDCALRENVAGFRGDTGGLGNLGTASLVDCRIDANVGENTGGVTNVGSLAMYRTVLHGNRSLSYAAAFRNIGFADVEACDVAASMVSDPIGAAVYNAGGALALRHSKVIDTIDAPGVRITVGEVLIERSLVAGNDSGGIVNDDDFGTGGALTVRQSVVSDNGRLARRYYGGLVNDGTATVEGSTISGNLAFLSGAGIANSRTLTVENSTLSGNDSEQAGGGLFNSGTATLRHVTISGNRATSDSGAVAAGGGIFNRAPGTVSVANSLLAANLDRGGGAPDCRGAVASAGGNVLGDDFGCDWQSGPADRVTDDVRLAPLAPDGGWTSVLVPLAGSAAIDAARAPLCATADQRGVARPRGAGCDAGAVEVAVGCGNGVLDAGESCDEPGSACCSPHCQFAAVGGDCDADGSVAVSELVLGVSIALDTAHVERCPAVDAAGDGAVTVSDLVTAVSTALSGCR